MFSPRVIIVFIDWSVFDHSVSTCLFWLRIGLFGHQRERQTDRHKTYTYLGPHLWFRRPNFIANFIARARTHEIYPKNGGKDIVNVLIPNRRKKSLRVKVKRKFLFELRLGFCGYLLWDIYLLHIVQDYRASPALIIIVNLILIIV